MVLMSPLKKAKTLAITDMMLRMRAVNGWPVTRTLPPRGGYCSTRRVGW